MCADRINEVLLHLQQSKIDKADVDIVICGSGDLQVADSVGVDVGIPKLQAAGWRIRMAVDPSLSTYAAFGLYRGVARTFVWRRLSNAAGLFLSCWQCCVRGRLPMHNAGDPWQQGGLFVLVPDQGSKSSKVSLAFEHRETNPGWPLLDMDGFIAALVTATGKKDAAPAPVSEASASVEDVDVAADPQ